MDTIEKTRTADNREIVRAFIDALFTKGDLAAVDDYLAEDFLNHDPPVDSDPGREGMRRAAALFRTAFPDWHATPDFYVAENDMVVEHFSATGTQRGEIFGAPATGRTVTLRAGRTSALDGLCDLQGSPGGCEMRGVDDLGFGV